MILVAHPAVVLGHEGAGVVERVGENVKSVKPGGTAPFFSECADTSAL